jgi:OmpA-OmpF porin, OOP family
MCQPRRWLWGLLPLALLWLAAGFLRNDSIQTDLTTRSVSEALKAKAPWASATFNGRDATVTGVSPSPAAQKTAEDAVDSVFGVRRVDNKTTVMAEAKPYLWSAVREGNKVTLGGFVPDESTKAKIVADTKAALPNTEVVDQMKIARGVPAVFGAATAYSLAQLARLPDGKASLSDSTLTITGTAPSSDIYQMATAAGLPQGVGGNVQIGLPAVSPYTWQAQKAGQAITLTGYAPSAEVKAKIAEAAKAAAPNATITDQMRLAAGAPAGLEAMATAAFSHLAGLTSGIANLTGANYSLTGVAPTVDAFNRVMAAAKALPAGFAPVKTDVTAPAISPYTWSAVRNGPAITLSGYVPDEATKLANAAAARAAVPNAMVTDQQSLGAGAPNGLAGMAAYAINQLGRLNSGTASLSNTAYAITGAAATAAVRDETVAATTRLPAGYTLARQEITAPTPPPVATPAPVVVTPPPAPVVVAPPPPPPVVAVAPPPPPAPIVVAPPPPPPVVAIDTCQQQFNALLNDPILFATNSDEIQSVSYLLLGRLAGVAKTCPATSIEIGAHTDTDGSPVYNQDLSERRAKSVVEFLVREGVAGTNLKPVGYGDTKPIATNDTPANKQKNRRVEFTVK